MLKPFAGGPKIALGMRFFGLRNFSREIGAEHLLNLPESQWKGVFLGHVANPTATFHVSMEGFLGNTTEEMIVNTMNEGTFTGWELQQLKQAGRLGQVNFYKDGILVPNPFK